MVTYLNCEIITIYSKNYGNRLQNYALQETLKKLGCKTTTNICTNKVWIHRIKENIKCIRNKYQSDKFSIFDKKNIKYRYTKAINKIDTEFIDFFIAGSDQIWNPNFSFNTDREFLTFTNDEKKIAYAASIGVSELSQSERERFKKNLSTFSKVSVREHDAASLLLSITNINPQVVLDPTFLLDSNEWEKIIKQSSIKVDKPFVVKYFLGIRDIAIEKQIDEYSNSNNYEIIDITSDSSIYKVGPAEFLYLLKNSEYNFVDSFHGTVFSVIFEKQFYTFSRPKEKGFGDMNSRFNTIFKTFDLSERYINFENENSINFVEKIDYKKVSNKLVVEREKSIKYLIDALKK